jgi:hypothetical protein
VLFGVRLARLRLAAPRQEREPAEQPREISPLRPLAALLLVAAGAATAVVGARLELWPVWAAGLVAAALSPLVHRP